MVNMAQRIRMFLLQQGLASPMDFWYATGRRYQLASVYRIFHVLRFLGLIEKVGTKPNRKKSPIKMNIYRIKPGMENDACWDRPWPCYWKRKGATHRISVWERFEQQLRSGAE